MADRGGGMAGQNLTLKPVLPPLWRVDLIFMLAFSSIQTHFDYLLFLPVTWCEFFSLGSTRPHITALVGMRKNVLGGGGGRGVAGEWVSLFIHNLHAVCSKLN